MFSGAQVHGGGVNDGLSMGISRLVRSGDLGILVVDQSVSAASPLMINFDKL